MQHLCLAGRRVGGKAGRLTYRAVRLSIHDWLYQILVHTTKYQMSVCIRDSEAEERRPT